MIIVEKSLIILLNSWSLQFLNELISQTETFEGINRPMIIYRSSRSESDHKTVYTCLASLQTQRRSFQQHLISLQSNENLKICLNHRQHCWPRKSAL